MKLVTVSHQAKIAIANVLSTAAKEQQISTFNIQQQLGASENGEAIAVLFTKWQHRVHVDLLRRVASVLNVGALVSKILHNHGITYHDLNECELMAYNHSEEHVQLLMKLRQQLTSRQQFINPHYQLKPSATLAEHDLVVFLKYKNIVIGYAKIEISSEIDNAVNIQEFCIDSKYRHVGYGSKFIDMLFEYIKEQYPSNISTVYMTAIRNDDIANEFCQVNKFKEALVTYSRDIIRNEKEDTFTFSE